MNKISITRALVELKTLSSRIEKEIASSKFISCSIGGRPVPGFNSDDEFKDSVKSSYRSINDLINNRQKIKAAIVASNAITKVTVAGKEMTVAEAIDRKTSILYEKSLLDKMRSQYIQATSTIESFNERSTDMVDEVVRQLAGKDSKVNDNSLESIKNLIKQTKEPKMIDPLNIKDKIEKLRNFITEFEKEIDFTLTESNTVTIIEY